MVNLEKVEQVIDNYVQCWGRIGQENPDSLYEDNNKCKQFELIATGLSFETLKHDELSKLASLLTRALRAQINSDHKFFWAYSLFLTNKLTNIVPFFEDIEWKDAFGNLVNLVLSKRKNGNDQEVMDCINSHLLEVGFNKWQIAGPLAFAVLEGEMRRKNRTYVNSSGEVISNFSISSNGNNVDFRIGQRISSLKMLFHCFEQNVIPNRGRACTYLDEIKEEIRSLYSISAGNDVYDMIYTWRNTQMHGKNYWILKVPCLMNIICLLVIDEIVPAVYNLKIQEIIDSIEFNQEVRKIAKIRSEPHLPWDVYPPDI